VTKKIDEVLALNLPVDMIAPSHGVIWRKDPLQIVRKYQEWARQAPEKKAVILYDTMWQATRRMADAMAEGLISQQIPCELFLVPAADRNDILAKVFQSKAILVGSPALNTGLLPTIAPILEDLRGLKFKNKVGAAFGSYGWSGENVALIEEHLKKAGIAVIHEGVKCQWQPDRDILERCRALGREVGKAVQTAG
jgi:anaerobic nitric oxide reductase flavorubredoxin